jgi:predicted transcriptional regulator
MYFQVKNTLKNNCNYTSKHPLNQIPNHLLTETLYFHKLRKIVLDFSYCLKINNKNTIECQAFIR